MEFTERGGLEQGFAPIFDERVRPALMALEEERLRRRKTALTWSIIPLAVAAALAGGTILAFGDSQATFWIAVISGILGVAVALGAWGLQRGAWTGAVAEAVMPAVCDHVGDISYDKYASAGFPVTRMQDLGLIGSYSESDITDRLDGQHRGTAFELVEARLIKRTRTSDNKTSKKTVFKGLLFRIEVPVAAPTKILIARDWGALGNALGTLFQGGSGRGMPRVDFDHREFERVFEVHADDPAAAKAFMPLGFREILLAIAEREGGGKSKPMVAGFEGENFYLALTRKGDFLSMGGLNTPVAAMEEHLHEIFADIEVIHRIIDRLHGA